MNRNIAKLVVLAAVLIGLLGFQSVLNLNNEVYALQPSVVEIGDIIFDDDFDNPNSGWRVDQGFGFDWGYVDSTGEYRVFITSPQFLAPAYAPLLPGALSGDFVFQVDVRQHVTGALSPIGSVGIFLSTGTELRDDPMFIFNVVAEHSDSDLNQTWAFQRFDDNGLNTIIEHQHSELVGEADEFKRLAMVVQGGQASLFINDVFVGQADVPSVSHIGVYARSFTAAPNMNARFDNMTLSRVNENSLGDSEPDSTPGTPTSTPDESEADAIGNNPNEAFAVSVPFEGTFYINDNFDRDWFELTIDSSGTLVVDIDAQVNGSSLDSIVILFDAEGNEIARNDDEGGEGEGEGGLDSLLETEIGPGTYTAMVQSFNNATSGMYDISISLN